MKKLLTINNPFQTVDEFHQRAGKQLGSLIHRLAGKYPQLTQRCGTRRMLLALSVAWALTSLAKAGDREAFEHIDEALSPPTVCGSVTAPSWGCVMVQGVPFFIVEEEQAMLRFLWDGFTIFIDHEGTECVGQSFFDFAESRQTEAYPVMGEESACMPVGEITEEHDICEETAGKTEAAPTPQPESQQENVCYLTEMVEGVLKYGDVQDVRNLLSNLNFIARHDDRLDRLRMRLLCRLRDLTARNGMVAENHYRFDSSVGQVITRGDGFIARTDL